MRLPKATAEMQFNNKVLRARQLVSCVIPCLSSKVLLSVKESCSLLGLSENSDCAHPWPSQCYR